MNFRIDDDAEDNELPHFDDEEEEAGGGAEDVVEEESEEIIVEERPSYASGGAVASKSAPAKSAAKPAKKSKPKAKAKAKPKKAPKKKAKKPAKKAKKARKQRSLRARPSADAASVSHPAPDLSVSSKSPECIPGSFSLPRLFSRQNFEIQWPTACEKVIYFCSR